MLEHGRAPRSDCGSMQNKRCESNTIKCSDGGCQRVQKRVKRMRVVHCSVIYVRLPGRGKRNNIS